MISFVAAQDSTTSHHPRVSSWRMIAKITNLHNKSVMITQKASAAEHTHASSNTLPVLRLQRLKFARTAKREVMLWVIVLRNTLKSDLQIVVASCHLNELRQTNLLLGPPIFSLTFARMLMSSSWKVMGMKQRALLICTSCMPRVKMSHLTYCPRLRILKMIKTLSKKTTRAVMRSSRNYQNCLSLPRSALASATLTLKIMIHIS